MAKTAEQGGTGLRAQQAEPHAQPQVGVELCGGRLQQLVVLPQRNLAVGALQHLFAQPHLGEEGAEDVAVVQQQGFGVDGVLQTGHVRRAPRPGRRVVLLGGPAATGHARCARGEEP
ncbi:hypothetical protein D3C84_975600 [compost metagenome]